MTSPTIQLATPTDRVEWNRFLDTHPESTYCHRWEWQDVFEVAYGKRGYYLYATEGGRWTGLLPLVHMKGRLSGDCLVSLPFLDQGGVLSTSQATGSKLVEAAFELLGELKAEGLDLRGGSGEATSATEEETHRYRFVLQLAPVEEELWSSIGPKVRNQIRKSRREGLETHSAASDELNGFYAVFARNMRDLGSPVHSKRLFREILSRFEPRARLYLTRDAEGREVAGGIAIRFKDTIVVPWASSLRSARSACPNHSLYWKVLQDAVRDGARHFDFGRSSVGTGTYRFKKQWGSSLEPLVWRFYDGDRRARAEPYLSAGQNARLADLWARLPLGLATRLGPLIRGRLPN